MGSYRVANISRCRSRPGMSIVAWVLIGIEVAVVIPWAMDVRPDRQVDLILGWPSIVEQASSSSKSEAIQGSTSPNIQDRQSSLVEHAQAFARIFVDQPQRGGPVDPARPRDDPGNRAQISLVPVRLLATVSYPSRPDCSMALIGLAGQEAVWVKVGSRLGQIGLVEVRNGLVIYRDYGSNNLFELRIDGSSQIAKVAIEGPGTSDDGQKR